MGKPWPESAAWRKLAQRGNRRHRARGLVRINEAHGRAQRLSPGVRSSRAQGHCRFSLRRQYAHLRTRRLYQADCSISRSHRQINRSREETRRCRRPQSRLVQRTHVHTRPLQCFLVLLSEDVVSGSVRGSDPAHERVAAAGACSSSERCAPLRQSEGERHSKFASIRRYSSNAKRYDLLIPRAIDAST